MLSDLLDLSRNEITASAPAVSDGTDTLTYAAFVEAVGRLTSALIELDVAPGDRVGVHLQKGVASFVAVHAVLRSGAVMVPIDPFAPPEHASSVLSDAGVEVLITDARQHVFDQLVESVTLRAAVVRSSINALPGAASSIAIVDWDALASRAVADPVVIDADSPAYIIYTSGSTGQPKGIVHSHRSALAYARLAAAAYELRADDRLANIASLHFDQSTFELYAAPYVGCSVTVVPDAILRFPANVSELVEREQVTVWYSVPYVLRQLTGRGALDTRDLTSIRWVLYGGESYPPDELADLMTALPGASVSNIYGPAEVNQCTRFDLTEPPAPDAPIPIGRAWAETEIVMVDEAGNETPSGPGELLVSTSTMMDRYWNRPDLTAASIIDRKFPSRSRTRWYRTGDLAEANDDGDLVFLGRVDNQVKIRGQRVELEALDLTLRQVDGVIEAAMVADLIDGDLSLVAVVETDRGAVVTLRDVQRAVAARHPRAAVPIDLVVVASLVQTATGKIDRNAVLSQARRASSG